MTHRECRDLFVHALYEEWNEPQRKEFKGHLAGCDECRNAFADLQTVAATMKQRARQEMTQVDWTIFWNELSAGIADRSGTQKNSPPLWNRFVEFFRFRPAIGYGAAALSILMVGILIGRLVLTGTPDFNAQQLSERLSEAERTILNERAQNYLQRSKILLLGIVNGNGMTPSSYGLSKQQEVSRLLVKEAGPLRSELTEADQQQMKKLIGDLEVILLQIANLEETKDFPALEIIRDGVERKGLLLKINLEQMGAQESAPAPPKNESDSPASSI
jgi:hypothetical protein